MFESKPDFLGHLPVEWYLVAVEQRGQERVANALREHAVKALAQAMRAAKRPELMVN